MASIVLASHKPHKCTVQASYIQQLRTFSFSVTQTVQYDSSLSCGVITQTVILCALAGLSFRSYATWLPNTQKLTCKYSKGTLPTARLGFHH